MPWATCSGKLVPRRKCPPRRTASHGRSKIPGCTVFWLSLGVCVSVFHSAVSPKIARPIVTDGSGVVSIERSRDKHSYVVGAINGHPVSLRRYLQTARVGERLLRCKIGLARGGLAIFGTAGGSHYWPNRAGSQRSRRCLRRRRNPSRVGSDEQALLSQNFLNKVEPTQGNDRMVPRARPVPLDQRARVPAWC
jgi:hypothetical protein